MSQKRWSTTPRTIRLANRPTQSRARLHCWQTETASRGTACSACIRPLEGRIAADGNAAFRPTGSYLAAPILLAVYQHYLSVEHAKISGIEGNHESVINVPGKTVAQGRWRRASPVLTGHGLWYAFDSKQCSVRLGCSEARANCGHRVDLHDNYVCGLCNIAIECWKDQKSTRGQRSRRNR